MARDSWWAPTVRGMGISGCSPPRGGRYDPVDDESHGRVVSNMVAGRTGDCLHVLPQRKLESLGDARGGGSCPATDSRARTRREPRRGLRTCSGRQGHSPVGASPTVPVARIRHVAIPQLLGVIPGSLRGVNGPAALRTRAAAVGAIGGPSKHGSLNITECLQPRETSPVEVALQGLNFVSRTCHLEREADASQEGTGERTGRSRRGTGPSAYARIMEITSGSTVFQQEARSNLQRLAVYAKAKPARGFRWGA